MCRIAGYLGSLAPLSALLTTPPHGLREQARRPRELPGGIVGSDGHGVGWFAEHCAQPARIRSILPIWADENLDTMAEHVRSSSIVASSRTATRDMPVAITNTPPFQAGRALFVHNGQVADFHEKVMDGLRAAIDATTRQNILGNTDTEYLAALLHDRRDLPLEERVRSMLAVVADHVGRAGVTAQLNVIVCERDALVAVRHALGEDAPSLHVRAAREGVTVASEALDDQPSWTDVESGTVLSVRLADDAAVLSRSRL